MADWIKMRAGLLTNPKVIRMARFLASDRQFINWWLRGTNKVTCDESLYEICDVTVVTRVTVGSLLSLWSAVNESASKDNFVKGITLFEVDEMAGSPSFGDALVTVGWAEVRHDGIAFPNFGEHNVIEKSRSDKGSGPKTGAQRTKEWRERQMSLDVTENVTCDVTESDKSDVTVTDRIEKKREEKPSNAFALPEWVPGDAWRDFEQMRTKRRKPMTDRAKAIAVGRLDELRGAGHDVRAVIEQTVLHSWDTFYELKPGRMNGSSVSGDYDDLTRGAL